MIEVEATEEVLIGLPVARVLGHDHARNALEELAPPKLRVILVVLCANRSFRRRRRRSQALRGAAVVGHLLDGSRGGGGRWRCVARRVEHKAPASLAGASVARAERGAPLPAAATPTAARVVTVRFAPDRRAAGASLPLPATWPLAALLYPKVQLLPRAPPLSSRRHDHPRARIASAMRSALAVLRTKETATTEAGTTSHVLRRRFAKCAPPSRGAYDAIRR